MANAIYPKYKQFALDMTLGAGSSPATPNVKAVLVDSADYTYSASHEFLSDVPSGGRVATSGNLGSKTFTNGLFDAADAVWSAASGDQSEAVVIYIDTGSAATSRLVAYFDTSITGAPVTPNSGDINLVFNASGIFQL